MKRQMSSWLYDQLRRQAWFKAGRQTGTVLPMALLARELAQIDLAEIRREEILNPQNKAPTVVFIDEAGPPYAPAPTPRFAQLSCLRRQRSR